VVVGNGAEAVRARVGDGDGGDLRCVLQAEQLGTGHAVLQARSALRGFDGDVLVLCGDVPLLTTSTLRSLLKQHGRNAALATVLGMAVDDPSGYGRIIREMDGRLSVVEHRDATAAQREVFEVLGGDDHLVGEGEQRAASPDSTSLEALVRSPWSRSTLATQSIVVDLPSARRNGSGQLDITVSSWSGSQVCSLLSWLPLSFRVISSL